MILFGHVHHAIHQQPPELPNWRLERSHRRPTPKQPENHDWPALAEEVAAKITVTNPDFVPVVLVVLSHLDVLKLCAPVVDGPRTGNTLLPFLDDPEAVVWFHDGLAELFQRTGSKIDLCGRSVLEEPVGNEATVLLVASPVELLHRTGAIAVCCGRPVPEELDIKGCTVLLKAS